MPDDTEAEILRDSLGAATAAIHCSSIEIAFDVIDAHLRWQQDRNLDPDRHPYRSIWMDAAMKGGAAVKRDAPEFCAQVWHDYGRSRAIFPA